MKKILTTASIIVLTSGVAFAQADKSTVDQPASSGENQKTEKMSPGTTGAMQNQTGGTATSPQDVQKQGGMGVGAEGDTGKAGKTMGGGKDEKPK